VPTFPGEPLHLTARDDAAGEIVMKRTLAELLDEGSDEPSALDLDFSELPAPEPETVTETVVRTPLSSFAVADENTEDRRYRRSRLVYGLGGAGVSAFVVGGSLALGL